MRRIGFYRRAGASLLAAGLMVVMAPGETSAQAAGQVTFAKDVAKIFQEKCQVCHRPGNIGPMSLLTYQEVRPWVRSIKNKVANRDMPPWYVDKTVGIQHFINDASLSDQEIDTIVTWVDAGAPLGDVKDMPPAKQWASGDRFSLEDVLGPPDVVIRSKAWTMPAQGPDVQFHADVDIPQLTEPRWVRASETRPTLKGRRVAHHVTTHLLRVQTPEAVAAEKAVRAAQPGADVAIVGRSSTPESTYELFTEWAQGKGGEVYPDTVGKLVMPGTRVNFDIHYHAVGEEITDVMEMAWWFHQKGKTPRYSAEWVPVGCLHCGPGDRLQIPPNTITQHQGSFVLQAPAMLHNFQPHMHYRGKAMTLEAIHPDGRREVINRVQRYNNTWHINYIYDPNYAPVFPKGTVLLMTAVHDNTSANKNNPDPRQWVSGGSRTVDEMGHFNEQVIYITEGDYKRITEERRKRAQTQN